MDAAICKNANEDSRALHYAAHFGSPAVVQRLLTVGASRNATDENGQTAYEAAQARGDDEIIRVFRAPAPAADAGFFGDIKRFIFG